MLSRRMLSSKKMLGAGSVYLVVDGVLGRRSVLEGLCGRPNSCSYAVS